jgi:hypothetical protein
MKKVINFGGSNKSNKKLSNTLKMRKEKVRSYLTKLN